MFENLKAQFQFAQSMNRKGLTGASGLVIAAMITIIVIVKVALPVTSDAINDYNGTGTEADILDVVPVMLALVALVVVANLIS